MVIKSLLTRTLIQMLTNLGHIAVALDDNNIQLPSHNLVLTLTGHKILITQAVTYATLVSGSPRITTRLSTATSPPPIRVLEIQDPELQEKLLTIINSNC